jgi:hypothetical protein
MLLPIRQLNGYTQNRRAKACLCDQAADGPEVLLTINEQMRAAFRDCYDSVGTQAPAG